MKPLNHELKQMCRRNRDGSYATQRDRERMLDLMANQLLEGGFRHLAATSLKPKHVEHLVARWQAEGLSAGTMKNRMAELRWWAEKIGKENVIARDNAHYGIANRQQVTQVSKARSLGGNELSRVTDPYTAMSLRLQAAFGLRREESIKIRPEWADRGNSLALKDSWTKGGRPRESGSRSRRFIWGGDKPGAADSEGPICTGRSTGLQRFSPSHKRSLANDSLIYPACSAG
jgi:hypothetical protein